MSANGGGARSDVPIEGVSGKSGGTLYPQSVGIMDMVTRQPVH